MKMPLVSLVIPVLNAARYLHECLLSISRQSFEDFEVIIVDDESSDNSVNIATEFCKSDPRFRIVRNKHGGVSRARNTGIDLAQGKYVGFADADDCLHPEMLACLVNTLSSTDSEVCVCAFEKGEIFVPKRPETGFPVVMDYHSAMKEALYQRIILNSPGGMLMRRELPGKKLRFREGIRYEDLDAFYRFYENATRIAYIPCRLYFYRQAQDSFIHRWSDHRLDALDVTDSMVDYMAERHPDLLPAALDRRFSAHFNILLLMLRNRIKYPESISRCMKVIRENRRRELCDPNVRLKNKLGALASYGGQYLLKILSRFS